MEHHLQYLSLLKNKWLSRSFQNIDLSSLVPNLVVGNSGEDSGVSIAIRGIVQ